MVLLAINCIRVWPIIKATYFIAMSQCHRLLAQMPQSYICSTFPLRMQLETFNGCQSLQHSCANSVSRNKTRVPLRFWSCNSNGLICVSEQGANRSPKAVDVPWWHVFKWVTFHTPVHSKMVIYTGLSLHCVQGHTKQSSNPLKKAVVHGLQ